MEKGYLLYGRYRIESILGRGGMGSVYRAEDENLAIPVAVKENLFTTEEYARQFKREATILASLRHNNLPRVTDHFVIPGQGQYLVMDFIEGEDLRTRIEKGNIPSERLALDWARQICDALHYLHRRQPPVVHRDIKPGNIRITPDGRAMLVDFGLARLMEGTSTTTGAKAMTPGFSPPEQYGASRTDTRTDIYALAATLYTLLAGAMPEDGLERALGQKTLTPLRNRNPKVSPGVAVAIEKALEILPENRFQTIGEFFSALDSSIQPMAEVVPAPAPATRRAPEKSASPIPPRKAAPLAAKPVSQSAPAAKNKSSMGCILSAAIVFVLFLAGVVVVATNWKSIQAAFRPFGTMVPVVSVTPSTATETPPTVTEAAAPPTETLSPTRTPQPEATPIGGAMMFAYVSDQTGVPQIYLRDLFGEVGTQLTDLPGGACQPEWSPDGDQLLFISSCENPDGPFKNTTIYKINADGSGITILTKVPGGDYDPAWSPDGERILMTSLQYNGIPHLYLMDTNGDNRTLLSSPGAKDTQARWSPDGKRIVFVSYPSGTPSVQTMNADGSNRMEFVDSAKYSYSSIMPDWAVNDFILYMLSSKNTFVIAQSEKRFSTTEIGIPYRQASSARFSPDGQQILFDCQMDCTRVDKRVVPSTKRDIYILSFLGGTPMRITFEAGNETDPVWRPVQ